MKLGRSILAVLLLLAGAAAAGGAARPEEAGGGALHIAPVTRDGSRPGILLHLDSDAPGEATVVADVDFSPGAGAHTELWLAALAPHPERAEAVALRLTKESGFFPRWRLSVAAPPGVLPEAHVDGVDAGLEYIDLGVALPTLGAYRATLSYSGARLSVALDDARRGERVYAANFRVTPLEAPLYPVAGAFGAAPSGREAALWTRLEARPGYERAGLLYDLQSGFAWRLTADGQEATNRFEFFSDERLGLRWRWPSAPVPGEVRAVLASGEQKKVIAALPWGAGEFSAELPPLEELGREAVLRLEYADEGDPQLIAERSLRILPNKVWVQFELYGRNHVIDPRRADQPIEPDAPLFGRAILLAERPLRGVPLVIQARYVPEELRFGEDGGARLVPLEGSAKRFTVFEEEVELAANTRLELPFAVELPPERGRVEMLVGLGEGAELFVEGAETPVFPTPIVPAFPGAEGWGMYTVGGRGGAVYEVTNLNDSGPGSLREAIEAEGPRTVVFRVSGTIELESDLVVRNPYLTIAGQTAPGDGITLKNYDLKIRTDHVVVRFLRVRLGAAARKELEGISLRDARMAIVDHASISWTIDQSISNWINGSDHTIQWTILSEPLHDSVHSKGPHGFAASVGGPHLSMHHNLFANSPGRNPSLAGPVRMDFRNNVIFNWHHRSIDGGVYSINIVNNYFKAGPATQPNLRHRIVRVEDPPGQGIGRYYVAGNYVDGFPEITADNWSGGVVPDGNFDVAVARAGEPFLVPPVVTGAAEEGYEWVLGYAGALLPGRDAVDERIVREVRSGEPTYGIGIVNDVSEVDGWPRLKSLPPPRDSDKDGMPDEWELARGLDPNDPADGRLDRDGDGYTNLEEYLNELAAAAFPPGYLEAWERSYPPVR